MSITTDLDIAPYFDDFDETKNYHRVLFKPGYAVQARELTQLQSILQNQIERFGENIIMEGSIVKGGNFTEFPNLPYVKIKDNNFNGQPITIQNYAGAYGLGLNSGVRAHIRMTVPGLESQSPDLATLYVKYTTTGRVGDTEYKTFIPGEAIRIYNESEVIDTVVVATADIDANPIGVGYGVTCGDGIIFQKGHFTRFEDQLAIVSKYTNAPDGVVVGFQTEEYIADSNADASLLDNAEGYNNHTAPGADRLQLIPRLAAMSVAEGENDEHFFAIQEYQSGRLVRRNTETKYNKIEKQIEKRTAEESGNYTVKDFNVSVQAHPANTSMLNVVVSPGLGYVSGKRVETVGATVMGIAKGIESDTVKSQDISANYGNYIVVSDVYGLFPFDSFQTISLRSATHALTTNAGATAPGTALGSARVRAVTRESATRYRLYLFDIKMNAGASFANVKSVFYAGTVKALANVVLESGVAVLRDASFKKLIFPIGKSAIKTVDTTGTDYTSIQTGAFTVGTSGTFDISLTGSDVFPYGAGAVLNSDQRGELVVIYDGNGAIATVTAATTSVDAKTLSVTVSPVPSGTVPVSVIHNVKRKDVRPTGKTLGTYYVRLSGNAVSYSLGVPDVHSVEKVYMGANTTFTEASSGITDVTTSFALNKGQTDDYYGLSSVVKRKGLAATAGTHFLVKFKAFRRATTGSFSQAFFDVNSYPVDDVSATLPDNKIRTEDIPSYTFTDGNTVALRDSIDFRFYADATASYATDAASASVNPSATLAFGSYVPRLIAPNKSVEATYSYYKGRVDRVVIDRNGDIVVTRGDASEAPVAPVEGKGAMTLATLHIPPYPSLCAADAAKAGGSAGVVVSKVENRRYTMRDIGGIERRVSNLEYYVALNALEKSAADMIITDSDGLDRFKNGIICDQFDDLKAANVKDDNFQAAVDPGYSEVTPKFRKYDLKMVPKDRAYMTIKEGVATLQFTREKVSSQPYATSYRNCVTDFYKFNGSVEIYPSYDEGYDSTRAPDITMTVDMTDAFADFTDSLGEFVPLQSVSRRVATDTRSTVSSAALSAASSAITRTTTTTTTTRTTTESLRQGEKTSTTQVGDFVTDIRFSPFMRENIIRIYAEGLRPNTEFHFFFDGERVDQYVASGSVTFSDITKLPRTSRFSGSVKKISNAEGKLSALFFLPPKKFYVGDRTLVIADVTDLNSIESATSVAEVTYRAYNYSVEKSGLELTVVEPTFRVGRRRTTNVTTDVDTDTDIVTNGSIGSARQDNTGGDEDPISQTFMVDPGFTEDGSYMFLSRIDLFFAQKSTTNGVVVEIRNTDNGYPGSMVIPYSRVLIKAADVNVSNNGLSATPVFFKSPIPLRVGTEYAIVVRPVANDPNYRLWIAKTGQKDVATNIAVTQDAAPGTLFTSTNNRAWTPYQDENMKYTLYKAVFDEKKGNIVFAPDDYEFFSLSAGNFDFKRGETVFAVRANAAGTVGVVEGSNVVTGSGTAFNTLFAVGDYIAVKFADGTYEVSQIESIASATSLTTADVFKSTASGRNYFKTVAGICDYINGRVPAELHLRQSSTKTSNRFAAGDTLVGEISNNVAIIGSIRDLPVSYVQPSVARSNTSKTSTKLFASFGDGLTIDRPNMPIAFNDNTYLNAETYIPSKSKWIDTPNEPYFEMKVAVETATNDASPTIDTNITSMSVYEFFINNASMTADIDNEGDASARFISKTVVLADGMDAADFKLWLTAYRPQGSNIGVFVKFKAADDPTAFSELPWTQLKMQDKTTFFSSTANRFDYKEFEYYLGSTILGNGLGAYLNNGNFEYKGKSGELFTSYKTFAVKFVMTATSANRVPRLKDYRGMALT